MGLLEVGVAVVAAVAVVVAVARVHFRDWWHRMLVVEAVLPWLPNPTGDTIVAAANGLSWALPADAPGHAAVEAALFPQTEEADRMCNPRVDPGQNELRDITALPAGAHAVPACLLPRFGAYQVKCRRVRRHFAQIALAE